MNKDHNKIEDLLSRMKVRSLSDAEKETAWNHIEVRIAKKDLSVNLLLANIIKKHMIVPLIVILGLLAGTGGTAAAANSAKPGDALFGLDQAVERIRINIARGEEKSDLRLKFAEERLEEIRELIEERKKDKKEDKASVSLTESSVVEIEADVFTNETVVKIETSSSAKVVFVTEAKTREEIASAINAKYGSLSKAFIEGKLDLEVEDRASRPEDKEVSDSSELSDDEKNRINLGLEAALNLVNKVEDEDNERLESLTAQLNSLIDELPENAEVKMNDNKVRIETEEGRIDIKERKDGDTRIDSRTEDGRVRVEIKDGVVEVRIKDDRGGWSGSENDDSDNDDSDDDDDSSRGLEEAEAKISGGVTTVKVEVDDSKYVFTTAATTREGIIAAIMAKYPSLTSAEVSAVLEIEHEDSDDDDEDEGDDNDEDEDEDDDDDRSGNSGKGSRD